MSVSKESKSFLENLRLYLFASGKNEQEIEEIVGELEDHLYEAEKNGKSVEDIIGKTPKEYMSKLANEMPFDLLGVFKYLPVIILGAFSYLILGDAIGEGIAYSLLELVGYPIIFLSFIFLTAVLFKYLASNKMSKTKEWSIFGILGFTPMALFTALIFLDKHYITPVIHFGTVGNSIAVVASILIFIGSAVWSKMWMPIILPIILILPELVIDMTNFQENTQLILTSIFIPLCFLIYFLTILKVENRKESKV